LQQQWFACPVGTQAAAAPGALRPQYTYDGWSGVPRLENNEPPLLQLYSNPKKAKLTVEVRPGPGFRGCRYLGPWQPGSVEFADQPWAESGMQSVRPAALFAWLTVACPCLQAYAS
jgi:hypothetical protein